MRLTATYHVYASLWAKSMEATQYRHRQHFIAKVEVGLLAWACAGLCLDSGADVADFRWWLRPHHLSTDFKELVARVDLSFAVLARAHSCVLHDLLRTAIVDGKWCVQTLVCNARFLNIRWSRELATGFFQGCSERPRPGGKYCATHEAECTLAPEECNIEAHREVKAHDTLLAEFKVEGSWRPAVEVPVAAVRAYEHRLLRTHVSAKSGGDAESCNKDSRKGVSETVCGRNTHGILAAVTPCLQIVAIRSMHASESLTQVLLLVLELLAVMPGLRYVLYDNACGVVRHLRKQLATTKMTEEVAKGWRLLAALAWVVDRLHWTYHRCWRDPAGSWSVPGVAPSEHSALVGVDAEAAEQVFHITERW